MHSSKQHGQSDPVWWGAEHTTYWQQRRPELQRRLRSRGPARGRDVVARVGPDEALVQRYPTTPRNISVDRAHAVPDDNWEIGTTWEQLEPALRLGVGARVQYWRFDAWSEELEGLLRADWDAMHASGNWEKMRRAVRRGFDAGR